MDSNFLPIHTDSCTPRTEKETGGRVQEDEAQRHGEIHLLSPAVVHFVRAWLWRSLLLFVAAVDGHVSRGNK